MHGESHRISVASFTTAALLVALLLLLSYTPLGFIPVGTISVTIVHLPVLIGLMTCGLPTGLLLGALFGCVSLFRAVTSPSGIFDPFFWNPLVSVLPRVIIPLAAWGVYRGALRLLGARKGAAHAAVAAGALCGSLVNTVGVLGMIYVSCLLGWAGDHGMDPAVAGPLLCTVALTNGTAEAIASTLLTPPVVLAVRRALRRGAAR